MHGCSARHSTGTTTAAVTTNHLESSSRRACRSTPVMVYDIAQTNLQLYNQLLARGWTTNDLHHARAAYELAADLFSGQYRCSGKPFVAHLVGTASVAAAVGLPSELVLAALLH